jgi:hypothetical protein
MLVSGLSVIKNGVKLGYPFLESIQSAIDICDEFLVVVDKGEDETLDRLFAYRNIQPKIKIIETTWSEKVTPKKCVLAQQTNIGLHQSQGTWTLYLQGNEVLHEKDLSTLRALFVEHEKNDKVEAMLFERLTFWGGYHKLIKTYPDRYKFTPRAVKSSVGAYSIRDAMSFAVFDGWSTKGRYPRAIDTGMDIYRYGKVLSSSQLELKSNKAVHEQEITRNKNYLSEAVPLDLLADFKGEHPKVMRELVNSFSPDSFVSQRKKIHFKERLRLIESSYYKKFGLPCWRNKRYKLLGGYSTKDRLDY